MVEEVESPSLKAVEGDCDWVGGGGGGGGGGEGLVIVLARNIAG